VRQRCLFAYAAVGVGMVGLAVGALLHGHQGADPILQTIPIGADPQAIAVDARAGRVVVEGVS